MPIGQYITYKCKKCGYRFTKYQGDVITPLNPPPTSCSKCGGELQIIDTSFEEPNPINEIFKNIKDIFKKNKKGL